MLSSFSLFPSFQFATRRSPQRWTEKVSPYNYHTATAKSKDQGYKPKICGKEEDNKSKEKLIYNEGRHTVPHHCQRLVRGLSCLILKRPIH